MLVDHKGNVQAEECGRGKQLNRAAFMIHAAVHAARPDANCAAHTHSPYGRAFAAFGRELDTITQDSCAFYQVRGHCIVVHRTYIYARRLTSNAVTTSRTLVSTNNSEAS